MVRPLGIPRFAAARRIAFPLAALVGAACGGSDFASEIEASVPEASASQDVSRSDAAVDASALDARGSDAALVDVGSRGDDAEAGHPPAEAGLIDHVISLDAEAGSIDARVISLDAGHDADAGLRDSEAGPFNSGTGFLMQSLGTAGAFVVLGGATVTNSGVSTVLIGDVGTTGPEVTGLTGPPFQPSGSMAINNARATQAVLDVGTAYTSLVGRACPPANDLTGKDLGGMTLAPGVYCFTSSAGQISATTLTFDAKGDPDAVWIIQVATALTVMDSATAVVIGGPPSLACRIFWTTGTAATINGGSHFLGNILASSKTSLLTDATLSPGRAFGQTAGVTLLSNTISAALCP